MAQRERARGDCHCAMYYERAAEGHRGRLHSLQQAVHNHRSRMIGRVTALRQSLAVASGERQRLDTALQSVRNETDRLQIAAQDKHAQRSATQAQLQSVRNTANTEREAQQQSQTRRLALQWDHSTITHNIAMRNRELLRTNAQVSRASAELAATKERLDRGFTKLNAAESRRQLLCVERQNKQDAYVEKERDVGAAKVQLAAEGRIANRSPGCSTRSEAAASTQQRSSQGSTNVTAG